MRFETRKIWVSTAIVPGRWFDMPGHFRLGLGGDTEVIKEGLALLGAALDELA